jgi:multidrug efflux system outer membrane protein
MKPFAIIASLVVVASCSSVGPLYTPPEISLEQHYSFAQSSDIEEAAYERWWTSFKDPVLNDYMEKGLQSSLDIQVAQEQIREAQALHRATTPVLSQLSGGVTASETRQKSNGVASSSATSTLSANYVFDLFGGNKKSREQTQANLESTIYDSRTVRLAFQSEVFAAYVEARYYQTAMQITRRTIENRKRTFDLIDERVKADDATVLESARARAELSLAQADLPSLNNGFEQNAVRLATLLSQPTRDVVSNLKRTYRGLPAPRRGFSAGVPANLLRNRPDILSAERTFAARMAAVGVAAADLYPSLVLSGSVRIDAANTFSIGPTLNIPIFGRSGLLANRAAAESRARQAELAWRATVLDAVAEVENTLSRTRNRQNEIASLSQAARDYTRLTRLSRDAFDLGASTLLELLDAEQSITRTEISLAQARRAYILALAELAVATGRGSRVNENLPDDATTLVMPES